MASITDDSVILSLTKLKLETVMLKVNDDLFLGTEHYCVSDLFSFSGNRFGFEE